MHPNDYRQNNQGQYIRPCSVCSRIYSDPNDVRDCCYDTLAAFQGSTNSMYLYDAKECEQCTNNAILKTGWSPCHRQLAKPVIKLNIPSYFPSLYAQTNDIEIARRECIAKCGNNADCVLKCNLQAESVVQPEISENFMNTLSQDIYKQKRIYLIGIAIFLFVVYFVMYRKRNN